jgi:hypothetical protein
MPGWVSFDDARLDFLMVVDRSVDLEQRSGIVESFAMLIKGFQHLVANVEVEDLKFLVRLQDRVNEIEEFF